MDDSRLKEAFDKVKLEINFLKTEIFLLKHDLEIAKKDFSEKNKDLSMVLGELSKELMNLTDALKTKMNDSNTSLYINSHTPTTHLPQSNTYSSKFEGIKPYLPSSNGNGGVPTLPQQTNTQSNTSPTHEFINKPQQEQIQAAPKISIKELVSSMKADLKAKFKALTKQEFQVFSVLFSLEEELKRPLSYKDIAIKANLTESTIRDYIGRLIEKGIPIVKERVNNRDILIKVSEDLRNLASLSSLSNIKSSKFE